MCTLIIDEGKEKEMDTIKKNELNELIKRHTELVSMKADIILAIEGEIPERTIEEIKIINRELVKIRELVSEIAPEFGSI